MTIKSISRPKKKIYRAPCSKIPGSTNELSLTSLAHSNSQTPPVVSNSKKNYTHIEKEKIRKNHEMLEARTSVAEFQKS